mmetsp:Transcript_95756/g.247585  ORF Transcript_95756/g.247585 Transcript_95756/m.247585 type:complete len:403 (+) Transcript_95756:230-1438(+)
MAVDDLDDHLVVLHDVEHALKARRAADVEGVLQALPRKDIPGQPIVQATLVEAWEVCPWLLQDHLVDWLACQPRHVPLQRLEQRLRVTFRRLPVHELGTDAEFQLWCRLHFPAHGHAAVAVEMEVPFDAVLSGARPHLLHPELHGYLAARVFAPVKCEGICGLDQAREDGRLLRLGLLNQPREPGHVHSHDHLLRPDCVGGATRAVRVRDAHKPAVGTRGAGVAHHGGDWGTHDVPHAVGVRVPDLHPKAVVAVLEHRHHVLPLLLVIEAQHGTEGGADQVRVHPPEYIEGGDMLQDAVALDLLAVAEDADEGAEVVLLHELHACHVNKVLHARLRLRRQAVLVLPEDFRVEVNVAHHGPGDGNLHQFPRDERPRQLVRPLLVGEQLPLGLVKDPLLVGLGL